MAWVGGMRWWQLDVSALIIRVMERVGLAKQVWRIPADRLRTRDTPAARFEAPVSDVDSLAPAAANPAADERRAPPAGYRDGLRG